MHIRYGANHRNKLIVVLIFRPQTSQPQSLSQIAASPADAGSFDMDILAQEIVLEPRVRRACDHSFLHIGYFTTNQPSRNHLSSPSTPYSLPVLRKQIHTQPGSS